MTAWLGLLSSKHRQQGKAPQGRKLVGIAMTSKAAARWLLEQCTNDFAGERGCQSSVVNRPAATNGGS